jgi:hypothetical protein
MDKYDAEDLLLGVENQMGQAASLDAANPMAAVRAGLGTLDEPAAARFLAAMGDALDEMGFDPSVEP